MQFRNHRRSATVATALVLTGLLCWPASGMAQLGGLLPPVPTLPTGTSSTISGEASAARVSLLGLLGTSTSTALADSGTLGGVNDFRDAALVVGSVPSILSAETLSSGAISGTNEVDSEASLANLSMTIAGIGISADLVMAEASQVLGAAGSGSSTISNLAIGGVPVYVTGAPNQAIGFAGGQIILNEQTISSTGTAIVNAIHVTVPGIADVVIASATAGIS